MTANQEFERIFSVPGNIVESELKLENHNAKIAITRGEIPGTIEIRSSGLVAAFNGSGDISKEIPQYQDVADLAGELVSRGGIVLCGGRNSGIMEAVCEAGGDHAIGIDFIEHVKNNLVSSFGQKLIVDNMIARLQILTVAAPIVLIYGGGIGTFQELISSIITVKNHSLGGIEPPRIFIHSSWRKTVEFLETENILKPEYLAPCKWFESSKEMVAAI